MPNVMICPSEHDLQQLLLGQIADAEAGPLEEHLEQCERCLQRASTLKLEDTLAEAVQAQATMPELSTGELVAGLMERLEKLRPAVGPTPQTNAATIAVDDTPSGKKSGAQAAPVVDATQVIYQFLAPPEAPEELGRLGPYRIRRVLGTGGMGVVFEALDPHLGRLVALKAMLPALASNPAAHQRFLREAQAVAAIEHDHIIAIHQVGEEGGVPYLAMPLLKGETLEERLKRETRLPVPLLLQVGRETAEGLAAAHARGLIHRDIKPANLWLELKEGETVTDTLTPIAEKTIKRVKILDFGLARAAGDTTQLTQLGAIVGTPAFMAPEQTRAGGVVDHRADLFSLGCVLYRAATGELPFKGADTMSILAALALDTPPSPHEVNADIPVPLSDLIMQLLAKKPDDRPASAQEVVAQVQAIEGGAMPTALRGHEAETQSRACPRKAEGMAPGVRRPTRGPGEPTRHWLGWVYTGVLAALVLVAYYAGPTVYRFATNQGELVITTDAPDVEVTVKQGSNVIKVFDKVTRQSLILDAGDYEIEATKGTTKPLQLSRQNIILERGGRRIVEVTFNPIGSTATLPKTGAETPRTMSTRGPMTTGAAPQTAAGALVDIWTIHALGRPTGKTLTQDGVTKDGDGWRIVAEEPRTVRLFEIPDPNVEDCTVIFRASMKSENVKGRAYLEMWCRFPGQGEFFSKDFPHLLQGTTDWSSFETPFYLKKGERPDLIKLNLVIEGKGTVWIKDLKLLRAPLPVMGEGGARAPDTPNAKPSADTPIREGVHFDGESWRIEAKGPRSVQLREVMKPETFGGAAMLIYSAEMKTKDVKDRAYLEMVCDFPGQGEFFSKGLGNAMEGTTDWSKNNTTFRLEKGQRPARVKLRVVIEGEGTVWVKNPSLKVVNLLNEEKADLPGVPRQAEENRRRGPRGAGQFPEDGELVRFVGHTGPVTGVRFSPDGKRVFSCGKDGMVCAWDSASARLVWTIKTRAEFLALDISGDGRTLLGGRRGGRDPGSAVLLDAASGKILRGLRLGETACMTVAFVGNRHRALVVTSASTFEWWDTDTGEQTQIYKNLGPNVACFAVAPDGRWAVSASDRDNVMRLWNLNRPEEESGFEQEHKGPIKALAYSPDGKRVLSGGADGAVRLWEVSRGRQIRAFQGPNGKDASVNSVAFSPDGRLALSGADHGTVHLWHLETGKEISRFRGSPAAVLSVAFSPDGLSVLSGGADGSVRLWRLPPSLMLLSD